MSSEREMPEGVQRKQIVTIETVREYLKERSRENEMTVSQWLKEEALPEDWEEVRHGHSEDEVVRTKVTPEVDGMIDSMTGSRSNKGEVIAYYVLLDALRNDDEEVIEELAQYVSEILWSET